jgi:histidinol-phosphate aminotransferase
MKSYVAGLHAYVPGKASLGGRPIVAKLSSNENPFGPSPKAVEAMTAVLGNSHLYPDPASTALREALAALHGIEVDRIICGTGSDELLHLVAGAFAGVGDEVLYVRHGFAVYDIAARRVGATPVVAPDDDYACDVDALLAAVNPRTRVVFLANPNNPTGTLISAAEVRRLHAGLPADCVFALDAAYAEFADGEYENGIGLARQFPNVVALRTFSKIYGLAAQRIGWQGELAVVFKNGKACWQGQGGRGQAGGRGNRRHRHARLHLARAVPAGLQSQHQGWSAGSPVHRPVGLSMTQFPVRRVVGPGHEPARQ